MKNEPESGIFRSAARAVWQTIFKIALFFSLYLSAFFYWAVRARSLGFLIGVNPGIWLGGMVGYSKFGVLRHLPAEKKPRSILLWKAVSPDEVEEMMAETGLRFPIILKPDTGLQSMGVVKISSAAALRPYLKRSRRNLILQEFVDTRAEFAVLYYRLPSQTRGQIFSFSERMRGADGLAGTECKSLNHLISADLEAVFEQMSRSVEGFYFGRFDILADDPAAVERGDFKIVELNGANSMPLHLYDPTLPLGQRVQEFRKYWQILYAISSQNKADGQTRNGNVGRLVWEMAASMTAVATV